MADETTPPADPPATSSDDLGDSGKRALEAERAARAKAEREARSFEAQLKKLQDKDKPEVERLTNELADARREASEAKSQVLRLEVASAKNLTPAQARRLVGSTKEELEADADELLTSFRPAENQPTNEDASDDKPGSQPDPVSRPKPSLQGGSDPTQAPDPDVRKVVDDIPRAQF